MKRRLEIFGLINRGFEGQPIRIECDIRNGFPGFEIVGLPDAGVRESKQRVRTALMNSGFKFPQQKVLVSLSPASQPKTGALLDLGIALSILFAAGRQESAVQPERETIRIMAAGELTLLGDVVQSSAALTAVQAARKTGCSICLVPADVGSLGYANVVRVTNLTKAFLECGELLNRDILSIYKEEKSMKGKLTGGHNAEKSVIFEDIMGLEREKEIIAMAAAGFHSMLLFGPPGVGKTMLATRVHLLLPPLSAREQETVSKIYGCADIERSTEDVDRPPMRMLPHDCTHAQFTGGQKPETPGEGALAHRGTLVLDEITKFTPKLLECVKDCYDKGFTSSSRSGTQTSYPARFLMTANMNPCPCGGLGNKDGVCSCSAHRLESHWNRVGRPLLERFDIRLPVQAAGSSLLLSGTPEKPDSYYRDRVLASCERQRRRYRNTDAVSYNGEVHFSTKAFMLLEKEREVFKKIFGPAGKTPEQAELLNNPRNQISVISLARSIADWEDCPDVAEEHFMEAANLKQYGLGDYFWRRIF